MTLPRPIASSQVDAKSPVDDDLMESIKEDLDYLDSQLGSSANAEQNFKVTGRIDLIPSNRLRRIDVATVTQDVTFVAAKMYLERPGDSGILEIDIKKYTKPNTKITGVERLFNSSLNSIARAGSSINTQSVTRSTAQISTQGVAQWKSSLNIQSIVPLGDDLFRYNFSAQPDADWIVGDSVTFASCSSGANNGAFSIVRVNDDNGFNVVIENVSGVAQSGVAGTGRLDAWLYSYTNPVSAEFAAGEHALFAAHADAGNNGSLLIYAINQAGNNIVVKNSAGVENASAGGTANTNRWIFAFSSSAPSDYVVGEKALMASHTSGNNDGSFVITAVNQSGNNVIVYNPSGVVQGGVAGNVNTLRWIHFFSVDPSTDVNVGDRVKIQNTNDANDDGYFAVKQVNRSTADNVVIYNENGVAQGGAAGTLETTLTRIKFSSDQSSIYTVDVSYVEIFGSSQESLDDAWHLVVEVNRGGGSNYNIIIDSDECTEQVGPAGRIIYEGRSIFSVRPSLTLATAYTNATNRHGQVALNGVLNALADVAANDILAMDILQIPDGAPANLLATLK